VLRKKADRVEKIDSDILRILDEMAQAMYDDDGVGLAAPQIGTSKRIIVADIGEGLVNLINPEIVLQSDEQESVEEGCLSFPGIRVNISRSLKIEFKALNEKWEPIEREVEGLWSRVIQHEIDHLNGILIIDHISPLDRSLLRTKLKKMEKKNHSDDVKQDD
jgi:peptide deformylase